MGVTMAINAEIDINKRARPVEKFDFFQDQRVRSIFYQLLTLSIVCWLGWYLVSNTTENLAARGMSTGFGFLSSTAGFDADFKLIEYIPGKGTYGDIFIIGALNTLFISFFKFTYLFFVRLMLF